MIDGVWRDGRKSESFYTHKAIILIHASSPVSDRGDVLLTVLCQSYWPEAEIAEFSRETKIE